MKKTEEDLLDKFQYYRMAIYTFALSSFLELVLLGEFKEEHLFKVQKELVDNADQYREDFNMCSYYLEKLAESSVEKNILNGIGNVGKSIGNVIGKIPLVEKGPVDEWLVDAGHHMKNSAGVIKRNALHTFAQMSDSGTWMFVERIGQINRICNHTSKICFDEKTIYLVTA